MKKLIAGLAAAAAMLFGPAALASTCSTLPYTFSNGSVADATQVMANFNSLLNCLNLNVAPLASPTFTGTVTIPTASITGNATVTGSANVSGTLGVSGAATFSSTTSFSGAQLLSTSAAAAGGDYIIMRPTDFGAGKPEIYFHKDSANTYLWDLNSFDGVSGATAQLNINLGGVVLSGSFQANSGLAVNGGFTLASGAFSVPAGSVVNADLDTVNSGPGACGSATAVCVITTNAQGRVTGQSATTIRPDTCATNSNGSYCINAEGYMHQAGLSASITAGNTGTVNLPGTCPGAIDAVTATSTLGGTNGVSVTGWSTSQLTLRNNQGSSEQIFWTVDCH